MNAPFRKKMMLASGLVVAGSGLGGCIGTFDPETDGASPIAPRVQALVDANRRYPRWEDFPKAPTDLPQPIEVAAQVNTLKVSQGALAGEVDRLEWTLGDPEVFAAEVNSRVDASQVAPVTAQTQAEIDAFARRLRERARAPARIDRD